MKSNSISKDLLVNSQNPYLGLESFQESNKDYFFGRKSETEFLVKLIQRNTTTVLSGKSGLGKTSLINAGVVPKLRELDFLPIYLRLGFDQEDFDFLTLTKKIINEKCREIDDSVPELVDQSLWEFFHSISILNGYVTPVLIFDQIEEIFTKSTSHIEQIEKFLIELTDLVENQVPLSVQEKYKDEPIPFDYSSSNCKVLLSLREDYLANMETLNLLMPSLKYSRFRLTQMDQRQAMDAILKPGKEIIEIFEARRTLNLLNQSRFNKETKDKSPPEIEIEPFLLSLVCYQINKLRINRGEAQITNNLLNEIEVGNILGEFYSDSLGLLAPQTRDYLETQLLTKDGFRKLQSKSDLLQSQKINEVEINMLIQNRILRRVIWEGREYIELIHDILIPIANERLNRLQKIKTRRKNLSYSIVALFVTLLLSSSIWGFYADGQRKEAKKQKKIAEEISDSLSRLTIELDKRIAEADSLRELADNKAKIAEDQLSKIKTINNFEIDKGKGVVK